MSDDNIEMLLVAVGLPLAAGVGCGMIVFISLFAIWLFAGGCV